MISLFEIAKRMYSGNYKLLAIVPLLLILTSLYYIPKIQLGVEFKGGTLISIMLDKPIAQDELSQALAKEGLEGKVSIFSVTTGTKAEIELPHSELLTKADETKNQFNSQIDAVSQLEYESSKNTSHTQEYIAKRGSANALCNEMFKLAGNNKKAEDITSTNQLKKEFAAAYNTVYTNYRTGVETILGKYVKYSSISVQSVSPLLSKHFIEKALWTVMYSILLSIIFVFVFFRVAIPSIAVLTGALSDVLIAMGAMGLFGVPLTLASFAALLMLIGFSLDTDVLLTTRMLKRSGNPAEKAADALNTGVTMSISAIMSFGVLLALAYATHIPTYYEIAAVAVAGLVGDIFATWGINAVIILWYVEKMGQR